MASRQPQPVERRSFLLGNPTRSLIPMGMATLLPDAAQRVRHLEAMIFEGFGRWGYREIIPPTFEYLDVLSTGLPAETLEKCYKFADWTTGRILVLRPDVTAQIARIVAMGMAGQGLPLRLSYRTTVFRYEPEHAGREREVFQLGVELIGVDQASMDAEILTLLVESLKTLGVSDFKVSLGHVGFYQGLLAKSGMSPQGQKQAEIAAAHKDIPNLERILKWEKVPSTLSKAILEAPGRYGREEVLEWGRRVAGRDLRLVKPIERLTQVYRLLEGTGIQEHLLLDLGEFRGFDYYDGIVFDVFSGKVGCELGGGGRYNHLIGRFGRELPSTGFALDIDRVFHALDHVSSEQILSSSSVLLMSPHVRYGEAFKAAQYLRSKGLTVLQETLSSPASSQNRVARKRAMEASVGWLVLLGHPRTKSQAFVAIRMGAKGNPQRTLRLEELPGLIQKETHASD
ncbi:ATP phosphoribosyltransferase regulatory subunit [Candidatus Nitronereus thalassa]|uniref:ATP phosphoribosyltransferase regulatory subunit n=1 Tax=Candidatus Nitronereus thalassa TaxID=3020898 RepID=A0ABU3KAM3_9BACT|nr:ATP phosphoribosyltransferase regulatory subunit [Candidatus Nitronereus thalassa]MDT7043540.1 ATP phosphoribosyltransferase regulatory subunit [Candidatus Nitronereus thalassa]